MSRSFMIWNKAGNYQPMTEKTNPLSGAKRSKQSWAPGTTSLKLSQETAWRLCQGQWALCTDERTLSKYSSTKFKLFLDFLAILQPNIGNVVLGLLSVFGELQCARFIGSALGSKWRSWPLQKNEVIIRQCVWLKHHSVPCDSK